VHGLRIFFESGVAQNPRRTFAVTTEAQDHSLNAQKLIQSNHFYLYFDLPTRSLKIPKITRPVRMSRASYLEPIHIAAPPKQSSAALQPPQSLTPSPNTTPTNSFYTDEADLEASLTAVSPWIAIGNSRIATATQIGESMSGHRGEDLH
jgi:hypothetical protein